MVESHETVDYGCHDADGQLVEADSMVGSLDVPRRSVRIGAFELVRPIGAGGMSLVFKALDTRSGQHLALKVLQVRGPAATQRLKAEFRALADIHHPNLVQLHELTVEGDRAFFTMELIHGTSVLEYLRVDTVPDLTRLKPTLRQLVDAVSMLHAGGMLHRDLKPSNILVQADGRVVVLDFGLARALTEQPEGMGSGTPAYMSPERLRGEPSSEPSDWYSVGVIIYEALTGELPAKEARHALLERSLRAAAAADQQDLNLIGLCCRLLDDDPARRPKAPELRAMLDLPPRPEATSPVRAPSPDGIFVGRNREWDCLHKAYERASAGHSVVVYLHGEPGIGKTALAKSFIQALQKQHEVLVLEGRCYEHELIPYNAADGLVDSLVQQLERLGKGARSVLVPDGFAELGHVFPALANAPALGIQDDELGVNQLDPHRLRQRAFAALHVLLGELSALQPLVIHLDDLQWGDADSAQLLSHLMQHADGMRMLLIASYRSADAERSACIRALRNVRPAADGEHVWELGLDPLPEASALELARALAQLDLTDAELQTLARESAGSPLFLRSLVQHHAARPPSQTTTFQRLMRTTLDRLPASTRELLELVALAARPLERELLLRAADIERRYGHDCLIALQRSGLLRTVAATRGMALDTYHDRVREIVTTTIDPAKRRRYHARLAAAEVLSPSPDPEFLAYQYERAEQFNEAARFAEAAGDRASAAVALDRAAELYALALRCLRGQRPVDLLEKLANATAYAGRCAQAAPLYLESAIAVEFDGARSLRLRLRTAEMLLRRGQVSESVQTVRPVLRASGVRYPTSAPEALLSIIVNVIRLRLHGRRQVPLFQSATEVEALRRELCFVLGYRLALVDPLPGSAMLLRSMVLALRSGTEAELARTLSCYAWILATLGWGSNEEQDRLLDRAGELALHPGDPEVKAWTLYGRAMTFYTRGHFDAALGVLESAPAWVATRGTDAGWLVAEMEVLQCALYVAKGEIAKLSIAVDPLLQRLKDSGNEFQSAVLVALRSQVLVARDEPQAAVRSLDETLTTWSAYAPAIINVWSKVNALMYQEQAGAAWQLMEEHWPAFGRAGYKRVNPWSVALPLLESTVALACAHQGLGSRYIKQVERGIRWLNRQPAHWAKPSSLLLQAGLSHLRGQRAEAARLYGLAAAGFEQLVMLGYANIARRRQSQLMHGSQAAALRDQAERWFAAQGIKRSTRWMRMYAPVAQR